VADKHRLPVVNAPAPSRSPEPQPEEAHPAWHWIGLGTVAVFVAWLPLSYFAERIRRWATEGWLGAPATPEDAARAIAALGAAQRAELGLLMAAIHGAALAIAAFAGGLFVGRYGGDTIGAREASLAGLTAALLASALAWSGLSWVPLVAIALAAASAFAGGRAGVARRPASGAR
jgi:hypothetical protein